VQQLWDQLPPNGPDNEPTATEQAECLLLVADTGVDTLYVNLTASEGAPDVTHRVWMRLIVPHRGDANCSRWRTDPFWESIQRARYEPNALPAALTRPPHVRHGLAQVDLSSTECSSSGQSCADSTGHHCHAEPGAACHCRRGR
jgi:hypothetical protein